MAEVVLAPFERTDAPLDSRHDDHRGVEKRDAEFARRFFGIWLAPETSEPRLRAALLGLR